MIPLAAVQAGIGVLQFGAGLLSRPKKRPTFDIPDEFNQNISLAKGIKDMGMPQEQYNQAWQNIMRNQSFGINALQNRRSALAGISSIVQRSNDAGLSLDTTAANIRNQNRRWGTQMEMGANNQLAGQKLQKLQWEKLQPFQDRLNQSQALMGAGMQNMMGGAQGQMSINMMDKMYPKTRG